ncbi:MAG: phosphotransferase [Eubacterium sp.]|nr:phosphotransferase [Eubacterium sp.]
MTVKLSGRIDSSNAVQAEANIKKQIGDYNGELVLDAEELEYISSVGLRIILRLKKANKSTKIINCSPEVYDIFEMTGFTEMMDISRAYRKLSVDGCKVLGEGANGIVYRITPDTVIKVYKNPDSLEEIQRERELARKAFVMGVPTAIPYDVVQVGELYGSVFELLEAKSFAKLMNEGASVEELAKQSVEVLKTIHGTILNDGELPSKKQEAMKWAEYSADFLPAEIGEKLVKLFSDIPETNNMLHGDFHIKNIRQQNGENLLIDMETLSMGHPVFELAAVFGAHAGYGCIDTKACTDFLGVSWDKCSDFWNYTVKYYFEGEAQDAVEANTKMTETVCYAQLLRWMSVSPDDLPHSDKIIAFCSDYLTETVPKLDKLYF